jgi:hypothetical protein
MSDESVRLALRVHDEVNTAHLLSGVGRASSSDAVIV